MVTAREESDAWSRLIFGHSQEYLDKVHEHADRIRAVIEARGPPPIWHPFEDSDSEFDDVEGAPMSPPPSPKDENVLDLSEKAWIRRKYIDLSQRIFPEDTGFDKYETWRSHEISEHAKRNPPPATSSGKPDVIQKPSSPPLLTASNRLVYANLRPCSSC